MDAPSTSNETAAFAFAPWASILLLATLFSIPPSPLFLDKLGDPGRGSWFAFNAILFDGTILAYVVELCLGFPVYLALKKAGRASSTAVLLLGAAVGVAGSQFAHVVQNFHQPGLRAFAESWLSPALGCVCGLLSAMVFLLIASRPKPVRLALRYAVGVLPAVALVAAAGVLLGIKAASH